MQPEAKTANAVSGHLQSSDPAVLAAVYTPVATHPPYETPTKLGLLENTPLPSLLSLPPKKGSILESKQESEWENREYSKKLPT